MYWKEPKYSINQVKLMIAEAIYATGYFDSQDFKEWYLWVHNDWPSPEQIEKAEEKFIENFVV